MSATALASRGFGVPEVLRDCGLTLVAAGPQRWSVALPEALRETEVRLEAGWLFFDSPPPDGAGRRSAWELLQANPSLAGPAKFALEPGRELRLKAELPVDDVSHLASRARAVCRGFTNAGAVVARPRMEPRGAVPGSVGPESATEFAGGGEVGPESASAPPGEPVPTGSSARESFGALCEEAGWSFTERSRERLMVALDVPGAFYQASVEPFSGDSVLISAELARLDVVTALGRRALSYLLLNACGLVRLARATAVVREDGPTSIGFEVRLELPLSAVELDHSLSSLSAAARLCGREVKALCVERLATAYLDVHESGSNAVLLTRNTSLEPGGLP